MKEKFALEKDYLQRKYDLLHTQLDDDGDAVSVRSRYQPRSERVVDWITSNPAVTMSANTGTIPTGLTSQLEPITHSMQQTSASAITNANRVHPAPGFISKVPPTAPSTTTSDSTPLPCYSNASITQAAMQNPVASVQQNFPSTSIDTSNMFVISPTIVSTASLSLPPLPTLPASSVPPYRHSFVPASFSSQPPQLQAIPSVPSSSLYRIGTSHTAVASCLPSGGIPSVWQQSTYVSMPPPTHHSTPTTVASERRPVGEQHLYNTQLVRSQGDQHNSASVPVSRISMHPGLGENGSSVGQYAQPTAVVSNTYGLHGMQSSYQNYLPNYWFPGANNAPLQILPQQENIASVARPALHLGGNTSQSGSQGIQINQNPVLSSQFVPGGPQRASLHGVGSNVPMLQEPNISGFPSAPLDYAPNTQQLAARHVVSRELPIFDGNPAEWPMFWSSYTTSSQMCGYTGAENLHLQCCLKGEAR